MTKGKFGIYLWFYAVAAFILTFLGQPLLCGLLLGFVIAAEKNEWLTRQVIQAFFLSLFVSVLNKLIGIVSIPLGRLPFGVGSVFDTIFGIVDSVISIVVLIFVIIALLKVAKGQEAGLPGLSTLANKAFGIVEKKVYAPMPPQAPQAPQYQPQQAPHQYQQMPPQPQNPQQPPQNPVQ